MTKTSNKKDSALRLTGFTTGASFMALLLAVMFGDEMSITLRFTALIIGGTLAMVSIYNHRYTKKL